MTELGTPVAIIAVRTRPLAPRHRIAHLRALIRLAPTGSIRRGQLAAWLRGMSNAPRKGCAV